MSVYLIRLFRMHPFFTFTGGWHTRNVELQKIPTHPNSPAYFLFETDDPVEDKLIEDSDDLLRQHPGLMKNVDFPFDIHLIDDSQEFWELFYENIEVGFKNNSDKRKDYINNIVNPAFLKKITVLSPKNIPLFLDCQLEMFKKYPKEELISNFFIYLEGLLSGFNNPQKVFVEQWTNDNKHQCGDDIPDLKDIFKDPHYLSIILQHENVRKFYSHERETDKYIWRQHSKQYLAAMAIHLRNKHRLLDKSDINNNQYLAKVFFKFFSLNYPDKGEKSFQPQEIANQGKTSQFSFITDF